MEFPVQPAKLERFMDDQAVLARIAPNPAVAQMHRDLERYYREQLDQALRLI